MCGFPRLQRRRSLSLMIAGLLCAPLWAQTVRVDRVQMSFGGMEYEFLPGADTVLEIPPPPNFQNRRADVSFTTTYAGPAGVPFLVGCGVVFNADRPIDRQTLITHTPAGNTGSGVVVISEGIQLVERIEHTYGFFCELFRSTSPFGLIVTSELLDVQQRYVGEDSVALVNASPDPNEFLAPGSQLNFEATVEYMLGSRGPTGGRIRLAVEDASGNVISERIRGVSTTTSVQSRDMTVFSVRIPPLGPILLVAELLFQRGASFGGLPGDELESLAVASPVTYGVEGGESLTIGNPRPPPSDPLFLGSATTIGAEVSYTLESVDRGDIVLQLLQPDGTELARGPPQAVSKGSGSVPLDIPPFELFPEPFTPTVLLRAVLLDPSGAVILQSATVEYTVEVLPCEVGPFAQSRLSPKAQDTSCDPDYTVLPIEAVQILQDDDNSVPLVANKRTALRIYLAHDDKAKPRPQFEFVPVDITLRHESPGKTIERQAFGRLAKPKPGPLFPRRARRGTERMAEISYLLPNNLTAEGELTVEVAVNRNKYAQASVVPERLPANKQENNVGRRTFRFDKTAPVDIEYLILCDDGAECETPDTFKLRARFRLTPIADSDGLRYSPFDTVDVKRPGQIVDGGPDFAGLLGRLAVFAAGKLVDYIVVWVERPSEEGEIIENLGVALAALGVPRLFTLSTNTNEDDPDDDGANNEAKVVRLLPAAHGIFPDKRFGPCPLASDASPPSTIFFFPEFDSLSNGLGFGDMHPSCMVPVISSSTYKKLFNIKKLRPREAPALKGAAQTASQDYFVITGAVEGSGGSLSSLLRASLPIPTPQLPETGDVCVESQAGGATPARQCVRRSSATGDTLPFVFLLPYDPAADRITLYVGGQAVDFRAASANPPTVAITAPPAGAVLNAADPFTLSWTAADADGDLLEFTVLYSPDGGGSWLPMAFDLTATSASFNLAHIAGGGNVFFRVLAIDGFHTSEATVGPVNVVQQPKAEADATAGLGVTAPGAILVGEVPIRSVGSGTLSVLSVDSNDASFVPQGAFPLRIRAGSTAGLPVEFTPSEPGGASAMLTVQTNDPDTPSLTVGVEATVRDPSEPILGPLEGSGPLDTFAGVVFGDAAIGEESVAAVTVINYGDPDLTVEPAVAGQGFRLLEEQGGGLRGPAGAHGHPGRRAKRCPGGL